MSLCQTMMIEPANGLRTTAELGAPVEEIRMLETA